MSWLKRSSSSQGFGSGWNQQLLQRLLGVALVLVVAYALADLILTQIRIQMLPQQAPPSAPTASPRSPSTPLGDYSLLVRQNFFHFGQDIPPPLAEEKAPDPSVEAEAILSQLPIKLEGTIVHANPSRSIATVNVRNSLKKSYSVGSDIEGLARLERVERRRITFRNLANSRLEYVEIPEDQKFSFGLTQPARTAPQQSDQVVEQISYNRFSVNRADVNRLTSDLGTVLNQARMVPNIIPGSGGQIDGFRFVSIQPDSIYEELGFKVGDVLRGVNNQIVNSPTQAMELFNALRNSNQITLMMEREGRQEEFYYTINE